MAELVGHEFTPARFRKSVTLPLTAQELEEQEEQGRRPWKTKHLTSCTKKVPIHIDSLGMADLAEALDRAELEGQRRAVLAEALSTGGRARGHKVKLSLGSELVRYLKVRAAQEGRTASAVAAGLMRAAISEQAKGGKDA